MPNLARYPPLTSNSGGRVWVVDSLVAVVVGAGQIVGTLAATSHHGSGPVSTGGMVLLGASAVPLVARRRFPVAALAATFVLTLWYALTPNPTGVIWGALTLAFGTAIYFRKRAAAIGSLVAGYVAFSWGPPLFGTHPAPSAAGALGLAVLFLFMLAVAEWVRLRNQRSVALAQRYEEQARRQAGEERLRIARELHDVVAHNISVINVQANTALHMMDRQPDRARGALTTINDVSKQALVELRSILGILRDVDEDAPLAPSAGLEHLDGLIGRTNAAGLSVRIEEKGEKLSLPTSVDLAAHRIIQEALTNTVRHSGATAAVVRVAYGARAVTVEVDDDGRGDTSIPTDGASAGIVGMTERAQALGGRLEAGPRSGGGYRVTAWLPLDQAAQ
ncbi:MAG TPA: sensor histidine kinase [Acidimicrobiales bacterium]